MIPVIDMHVHAAPSLFPRSTVDLDLASRTVAEGLGGFLLKAHHGSSVERAFHLQRLNPDGVFVGGLVLNSPVGGINPAAAETAARLGARQVWFPTHSAAHARSVQPDLVRGAENHKIWGPQGYTIFDDHGKLRYEVYDVLDVIRQYDLILGTGHLAPEESLALVDAALDRGVKKILFTHPELPLTDIDGETQKDLAARGVIMERCYIVTQPLAGQQPFRLLAHHIRTVGIERNVLATDFGLADYPNPVDAMLEFIGKLQEAGFRDQEIEQMGVTVPRQLLGLA